MLQRSAWMFALTTMIWALALAGTGPAELQPTVKFPNGGEELTAGVPVQIQWLPPSDPPEMTRIVLSTDGGKTYEKVLAEIEKDPLGNVIPSTWMWNDPQPVGMHNRIRIQLGYLMAVVIQDESDADFAISAPPAKPMVKIASPNGGEIYNWGEAIPIRWMAPEVVAESYEIRLSKDGGMTFPIHLAKLTEVPQGAGWIWKNDTYTGKEFRVQVIAYTKEVVIMDVSDGNFALNGREGTNPSSLSLSNHPNPFNPVTTIAYDVPQSGMVRLAVYDVLGREVSTLVNGAQDAGRHTAQFDGGNLPSGVYLYRLETADRTVVNRMELTK